MSPPEVAPHPDVPAEEADALLHRYLAGRSTLCPACDYNLRDLTSETCPECGEKLVLRIGLFEPRLGVFIAGLVGLALSAGFSGSLMILGLLLAALEPDGGAKYILPWAMTGSLVQAFLLTQWIKSRKRMRRYSPMNQKVWAALCWAVPLVNIYLFLVVTFA